MSFGIREIRHEELDEAVSFAQQRGSDMPSASRVRQRLSIVARNEDGDIMGVVFCRESNGITLELAMAEAAEDGLAQQLMDKALSKLRCENVHCCAIKVVGGAAADHLWSAARWLDSSSDGAPQAA